jgi:hypothetical protein
MQKYRDVDGDICWIYKQFTIRFNPK